MKKILFPTDFSEASLNAFVYALHLARDTGAEIMTLHVYDLPSGTHADESLFLSKYYQVAEWTEFENYKSEVPLLRDIAEKENLSHVKLTHILQLGATVSEILHMAESESVQYIVLGTTGATGLREVFLGSVAEKIINNAKSIVLAIPSKCRYQPIKKILFLTQFQKAHLEILRKLQAVASIFPAHIDALEVKTHHDSHENEDLMEWKSRFAKSGFNYWSLATDDYETTVMDFIDSQQIDMVAMAGHHKSFIEKLVFFSLSKQMAFHSKVPVLSINAVATRTEIS